jgi:hypothetical protein
MNSHRNSVYNYITYILQHVSALAAIFPCTGQCITYDSAETCCNIYIYIYIV